MDIQTMTRSAVPVPVPPFDPRARERIEQVASALIDLCGRLEARIVEAESRVVEMEARFEQMGMVPRG